MAAPQTVCTLIAPASLPMTSALCASVLARLQVIASRPSSRAVSAEARAIVPNRAVLANDMNKFSTKAWLSEPPWTAPWPAALTAESATTLAVVTPARASEDSSPTVATPSASMSMPPASSAAAPPVAAASTAIPIKAAALTHAVRSCWCWTSFAPSRKNF